jgi:putative transposase
MPPIRPELLDELLKDYQKPDDLLGQDGLLQQLTKALVERALGGELTHHLGYERHDPSGNNSGNSRNGTTPKTLRGKRGQVQIDVPVTVTASSSRSSSRRGRHASTASTRTSSPSTPAA